MNSEKSVNKSFTRFTLYERGIIEYMYKSGYTVVDISKEIKKSYNATWIEINRNSTYKIVDGKK